MVSVMNDELDPCLKRLFAETAEHPADEAFVAMVSRTTSRRRRLMALVRALGGGLLLAVVVAALASGLGVALNQSRVMISAVIGPSPIGWVAGLALAFAGAVLVRTLAPVVSRIRA